MHVIALNCPNCGAPLTPSAHSPSVRCAFCEHVFALVGDARRAPADPPSRLSDEPTGALALRISRDGIHVRDVTLDRPIIKIGSLPTATLPLADDPQVSRLHAVIEITDGTVVIIDLGSAVGTKVNGKSINKAQLHSGDVIDLGATRLEITF